MAERCQGAAATPGDAGDERSKCGVVGRTCVELDGLVRPEWPPLRHVRRGWDALSLQERTEVQQRIEDVMAKHRFGDGMRRDALQHFFSFLAQVETIAIEIPLRFLSVAPEEVRPLLRRQLVDEVFHSALFSRLAHELAAPEAQPSAPLASAERLLDRIRAEEDLSVSATLLNLVAEGWIENLFKHALRWGVADAVFEAVLEDESRHVHEATDYIRGLDASKAQAAVEALEEGLMEVSGEATVGLSMLELAGEAGYQALVEDLWRTHREHLALAGLVPSARWQEMEQIATSAREQAIGVEDAPRPEALPDTPWRRASRRVWDTPRDPTMQGEFDVPVGHIPKKLLTPVIVAALGQAWATTPRLNRILQRDTVYQLPQVNVGVRVLVADDELATVVVTHADKRSVKDISRMIIDGVRQLEAIRKHRIENDHRVVDPVSDEVAAMAPVSPDAFAVALSNPGKFGMVAGGGAFSGALAPSTDISVGQRRRLPVWKGIAFVPQWHVNMGALQDHRLFDGKEAGMAMTAIREALSRKGVKQILRRPDTLGEQTADIDYDRDWMAMMPPSIQMLSVTGITKWVPYTLGGLGLTALGGVGGYFLYTHLAAMNAAAAANAGSAAASSGAASMSAGDAGMSAGAHGAEMHAGEGHHGHHGEHWHEGMERAAEEMAEAVEEGAKTAAKAGLATAGAAAIAGAAMHAADQDEPLEAADPEGPILEPFLDDGRPRCRAIKVDGAQCGFAAKSGNFCGRHA